MNMKHAHNAVVTYNRGGSHTHTHTHNAVVTCIDVGHMETHTHSVPFQKLRLSLLDAKSSGKNYEVSLYYRRPSDASLKSLASSLLGIKP